MDRHSGQLDELDVEGILAFAERVLPRAADLWVQASHSKSASGSNNCSFPREWRSTEKAFVGTRVTAPAFSYLRPIEDGNESVVDQNSVRWNRLTSWLRKVEALRRAP